MYSNVLYAAKRSSVCVSSRRVLKAWLTSALTKLFFSLNALDHSILCFSYNHFFFNDRDYAIVYDGEEWIVRGERIVRVLFAILHSWRMCFFAASICFSSSDLITLRKVIYKISIYFLK